MNRLDKPQLFRAVVIFIGIIGIFADADDTQMAQQFLTDIRTQAEVAEKARSTAVEGADGWLFFATELRHLSVGRFWGDAAAKVSRALKPEHADPLPAILDFKAQLDKVGIELILVPVPAKAAIYPEKISDQIAVPSRVDRNHLEFYDLLRKQGVNVLDLTTFFIRHRFTKAGPLYCEQDTHWSGYGCILAAQAIAEAIGDRPWLAEVEKRDYQAEMRIVEITGDLWKALGEENLPREQLQLTFVRERTADGTCPVAPWRESPIVLLGDSHNLVFHSGGDMHSLGSGLPDHLAHRIGFPVDLVAVRGSGATPSRLSLFRRRDNMKGKQLVIWCFSIREFTEGQGWRKIPVIR